MENTTTIPVATTWDEYYSYTDSYDYYDTAVHEDIGLLPARRLLPAVVGVSVVVTMAVVGNVLVLWSYLRDQGLRTVSNIYIVNLAICDFLLGSVSMPFYLIQTAHQLCWPFGPVFCKIYLVVDYTMCSVSVLLVILISQDQLLMLRKGALYATTETKRKAYLKLCGAWMLAFLLYSPAIIGWEYWAESTSQPRECEVGFYSDHTYTFITAMLEFFLPMIVLVLLNGAVYWEIRKRTARVGVAGSRPPSSREVSRVDASQNSLANVNPIAHAAPGAVNSTGGCIHNGVNVDNTPAAKPTQAAPKARTVVDKKSAGRDRKRPPAKMSSSEGESDSTHESRVQSDPEHSVDSVYDNAASLCRAKQLSADRNKARTTSPYKDMGSVDESESEGEFLPLCSNGSKDVWCVCLLKWTVRRRERKY